MFNIILKKFNLDLRFGNIKSKPEFSYSVWMFFAQFGVSISAFLLTYVMANYVQDTVVGYYRYILAVYSSISVFALIGLSTALSHAVSTGKSGSYLQALKVKFLYSCVASVIFFAIAGYIYFIEHNFSVAFVLILTGVSFPVIETFSLYLPYLNGNSDFKKSALFLLINRVLTTLLVTGSVFWSAGLIVLVSAYLLGQIVSVLLLHRLTMVAKPPNTEVDPGMVPYAKHVTLMSVIGAITAQLDKYILIVFFGPVALAKFWFASVLPQEMNRGISIIVNTFFPRFAAGTKEKNRSDVKKLFFLAIVGIIVIILLYALVAPALFSVFLPLHMDAVRMSILLMVAYGFVPYYFVWQVFSAQKDVKIMYVLNSLEPLILIVSYVILVPLYGVMGIIGTIFIKNLVFNIHALYYVLTNKAKL